MRYLDISPKDQEDAETRLNAPREVLGHLSALSVSGNDVSGSVFYAFPVVFAAAGELSESHTILKTYLSNSLPGVYSPLCLLTASLLLLFFRPLLLELAATVRINGS